MTYLAIFISKIIENSLATLRIILVSNGKKRSGALLQGLIMLIWVLVTGYVVTNVNEDLVQVLFLCLGSMVGSYLGSVLEEKIALGTVKLIIISDKKKEIFLSLKKYKTYYNDHITVIIKRKLLNNIIKEIKTIDSNSIIVCEKIKIYDKSTICK